MLLARDKVIHVFNQDDIWFHFMPIAKDKELFQINYTVTAWQNSSCMRLKTLKDGSMVLNEQRVVDQSVDHKLISNDMKASKSGIKKKLNSISNN